MATVNTAFGVLPSPKTQLLGGNAGGGVGSPRQPRQPQQPRASQGQGLAPGAAPTFAQLQQQGQARPAPPMQPGVQPARPLQQPPMLARLGAQLAPRQATQAQAQPQGGQQAPQQSRVLDYNAADAAQRASGGPAATPWRTTNAQGNVTSTFAPAVPAEYEYYIPLGETARVRNPAYQSPESQRRSDFERQMQAVLGEQMPAADVATGGRISPEQWDQRRQSAANQLATTYTTSEGAIQGAAQREAEFAARPENKLQAAGYTLWPTSDGQGYQVVQMLGPGNARLVASLTKDFQATDVSAMNDPNSPTFGQNLPGGELPDELRSVLGGGAPPLDGGQVSPDMAASLQALFAQGGLEGMQGAFAGVGEGVEGGGMNEGGMGGMGAAPATASSGAAPFALGQSFQQGAGTQSLMDRLARQLTSLEEARSVYDDPAFAAQRQAAIANLQAERQASESALNEEMARRGIAASSITAGRMGDIAGQFARAQSTMEADLLKEAMAREQQRQQFLVQQLGQTLGTVGEQELGMFRASMDSAKARADVDARAAELQQEALLRGRELDLTSARDQASQEQARGQLALGYAEMGSRERMSAQEIGSRERMQERGFTFEAGQSALERSLREKMQTTQLTSEERRQLTQIEAERAAATQRQTFEAGQSQLERTLREKMQTTELTAQEKRQLAEIEANKAAQADRQKFEAEQAKQNQTWQAEQGKLDRDLRSLLSKNELDAAQARFEKTYALDLEKFGFEKGQASNQFLSQLATVLAPMDPKKRDEFLRTIGIKLPGTPAGSVGGTSTGGAYGTDTGI